MKILKFTICLLIFEIGFTQDFSDQWTGYFSYLDVRDISIGQGRVIAAAQNAIFEYNPLSQAKLKTDAVNGLEGSEISAIHYSEAFGLSIIGYENGLLQVVMDNNGQVFTVVDILNKQTIAPDDKRINHFLEYQDKVFISTEFGVAEYNLANLEFGDSFFIGQNGEQLNVTQTAVFNSILYASTFGGSIRYANVNDPNLVDFDVWQTIGSSNWRGIINFNDRLLSMRLDNSLFEINNNNLNFIRQFPGQVEQLNQDEEKLIVVTPNTVHTLNTQLNEIGLVNALFEEIELETNFNTARILNDNLFIGDAKLGLLQMNNINSTTFQRVSPDGPILNAVFSLTSFQDELWVVYGGYNQFFVPFRVENRGVSHFREEGWSNLTNEDLDNTALITDATVDVNNPNRVYLSSYRDGLLILENEEVVTRLDPTNSNLDNTVGPSGDPIIGNTRIGASVFNTQGDLYMTNSITENPLKRLTGENQISIADISETFVEPLGTSSGKIATDSQGNVYMATFRSGLFGYQPSTGNSGKIARDVEGVDLPEVFNPNPAITAMEFDPNNRMWIGTAEGVRVSFNPQAMFDEEAQLSVSPIIFLENGVAQELLFQQFITDIKADGAGNVWIGTVDSGVFQVNSTGQETLNQFNQDNSPLPSNSVISIEINGDTGEVFFGTSRGLVSFQSRITDGVDNLENVRVFPNPVKPDFNGLVTIDGLTDNANVKITDVTGNLVYEEFASGGSLQWDTRAFGKHKVASGVYMVIITGEDQVETKVSKIMIIR
ncbi:type IX secretion system anionic LPS delivery protein PorZ [Mesohalobacter halotolerans]|uniref:T9SS type A sorting domain-containing protein n=1 Tax=Mesohalobacter halotolerans TaxID=1883405 RepID=A0A4U5TPM6_9FLAO|nr:T9SS type A sorting domain-containing protein [Mesohalobacter halotolerans]MBS3738385.1 T9SS type A sorting domain-containing protein [Psychroflexus sp.]TKS56077.1 T9SS type A sorting domain-containing protein [Mesohalobacter halotolerans]